MVNIALVIYPKNEEETLKFISSNKPLFLSVKLLVTRTEKNKIHSVLDKKGITLIDSLENKGNLAISSKASHGDLTAIFYFKPLATTATLELLQSCIKKKVYFGINPETADCIMQRIATEKGLADNFTGTNRRDSVVPNLTTGHSKVVVTGPLSVLVGSHPDLLSQERRKEWSSQQLLFWLESNELEYLKDIFMGAPIREGEQQIWTRHETFNNFLQVKSGSVVQLVDLLLLHRDMALSEVFDHEIFVRDWFMTFHCFTTPMEFLNQMKNKFISVWEEGDRDEALLTTEVLCQILLKWVTIEYAADFAQDAQLYSALMKFIQGNLKDKTNERNILPIFATLNSSIEAYRAMIEKDHVAAIELMSVRDSSSHTINLFDHSEIARQMTMMECSFIGKMRAREFHKTAWSKKNAKELAPHLSRMIEVSNHHSNWVTTEILRRIKMEDIAEMITKFIKVAKALASYNNFSGLIEVVTALNNSAIGKLKTPWGLVPSKLKETFDHLSELVSPLGHYKKYRDAFMDRSPTLPCLPVLPAILSDLNGYEEVFSSQTHDGSVNWAKMHKISGRIWEVLSVNANYDFKPVPALQEYIQNSMVWTDNITTCAIADLRMRCVLRSNEHKDREKRVSKRRLGVEYLSDASDMNPVETLNDREWQVLLSGTQHTTLYQRNQTILAVGDLNDKLFRIKRGTVRVIKSIGGLPKTVATMTEGSIFGEISMLLRSQKEGTATASIIADTEVELWALNIDYVMHTLESKHGLAEKLHHMLALTLARRLRDLDKKTAKSSDFQSEGSESDAAKQGGRDISSKDDVAASKYGDSGAPFAMKPPPDENARFNKKFGLVNEKIIKTFECAIKSTRTLHGTLYLSNNYLNFDGSVFGLRLRETLIFTDVMDIKKKHKYIAVSYSTETEPNQEMLFSQFADRDEAFSTISRVWDYHKQRKHTTQDVNTTQNKGFIQSKLADKANEQTANSKFNWMPSPQHWDLILKGARTANFKKDDILLSEGEKTNRLFQLVRGECRFEKVINGRLIVLGKLDQDNALFGEISFLEGGYASASVVCDKDETQVAIIEGYWLDVLFHYYPELSGRWYHYLANVLSKRLKQREASMSQTPVNVDPDNHN